MSETSKVWRVSKWADTLMWEGVDISHTQPPTVTLGTVEAPTKGAAIMAAVSTFKGVSAANLIVEPEVSRV